MSETIAQDCLVQGGQLIVGGDLTPLRTVGFANCPTTLGGGIPGAAAISGPVLIGQRLPFADQISQGTVMISRVNPVLAPNFIPPRPIVSIQNNFLDGSAVVNSPTDVLIGNFAAPVGVGSVP